MIGRVFLRPSRSTALCGAFAVSITTRSLRGISAAACRSLKNLLERRHVALVQRQGRLRVSSDRRERDKRNLRVAGVHREGLQGAVDRPALLHDASTGSLVARAMACTVTSIRRPKLANSAGSRLPLPAGPLAVSSPWGASRRPRVSGVSTDPGSKLPEATPIVARLSHCSACRWLTEGGSPSSLTLANERNGEHKREQEARGHDHLEPPQDAEVQVRGPSTRRHPRHLPARQRADRPPPPPCDSSLRASCTPPRGGT